MRDSSDINKQLTTTTTTTTEHSFLIQCLGSELATNIHYPSSNELEMKRIRNECSVLHERMREFRRQKASHHAKPAHHFKAQALLLIKGLGP